MGIEDRKLGIGTRDPGPGSRLIVGLGITGESVVRFLTREGVPFAATDSRPHPPGANAAKMAPHSFGSLASPLPFSEIAEAIVSPGVSLDEPFVHELRDHGVPLVSDIELFARALSRVPSVVAVTGTNGKSTVCSLLAAMAAAAGRRVAAGANLGTPALDLLAVDVELYVLELSSFQLELTHSLAPLAAAVLNVSPDHLDRHRDFGAYSAAKARIYEHAQTAVANRDDREVRDMIHDREGVVSFGLNAPGNDDYGLCEQDGRTFLCRGEQTLLAADEVPLAGRHNLANVLAAWALGTAVGLADDDMARAVRDFRALPHRLAPVGERGGVKYLDDSKATNVVAACAALAGLSGPLVVIAGGEGKGQDFASFAALLALHARAVVLIGDAAGEIARAIAGRTPLVHAGGMSEAVGLAASLARAGDRVVLAPACASLDMFRDYNERGDAFARAVEVLDGG